MFLSDKTFIIKEEEQPYKANLLAKEREKLGNKIIRFNSGCITCESSMIHLMQEKQCKNLYLITLKLIDLTSSRRKIQKVVTPIDQYIT